MSVSFIGFNCCLCVLACIFGGLSIYYSYQSSLDIHHVCALTNYNTRLCSYQCGQYCHYTPCRTSSIDSDTSISIKSNNNGNNGKISIIKKDDTSYTSSSVCKVCHPKYCWGFEYVYIWRTMDFIYPPYKSIKLSDYDYTKKPITQTDNITDERDKLVSLLDYVESFNVYNNTETLRLKNPKLYQKIQQINIDKYLKHGIVSFEDTPMNSTNNTITTPIPTSDEHFSCNGIFISYGTCSAFPWRSYSLYSEYDCWSNKYCTDYSWFSPKSNATLAYVFKIVAFVFCGLLICVILVFSVVMIRERCRDRHTYLSIPDISDMVTKTGDINTNEGATNDDYTIRY